MATIRVIIDKTGTKVTTKVEGVAGPSCKNLTEALHKALGSVESSTPTDEMYQTDVTTEIQTGQS